MPSGVIGKIVAQNIIHSIKVGKIEHPHTASMAKMGAACIVSAGYGLFKGQAAVMTVNPIVQDCCEAFSTWNEEGNLAYFKIEDLNVYCIGYKRNSLGGFEIEPELVAEKIMELNIL